MRHPGAGAQVEAGHQRGIGRLQLRARRHHARTSHLQVRVACQRCLHMAVQLGIAQRLPPLRCNGGGCALVAFALVGPVGRQVCTAVWRRLAQCRCAAAEQGRSYEGA
ncbi:hypothetical protein D3C72_1733280 [compost metagenome]